MEWARYELLVLQQALRDLVADMTIKPSNIIRLILHTIALGLIYWIALERTEFEAEIGLLSLALMSSASVVFLTFLFHWLRAPYKIFSDMRERLEHYEPDFLSLDDAASLIYDHLNEKTRDYLRQGQVRDGLPIVQHIKQELIYVAHLQLLSWYGRLSPNLPLQPIDHKEFRALEPTGNNLVQLGTGEFVWFDVQVERDGLLEYARAQSDDEIYEAIIKRQNVSQSREDIELKTQH